MFGLQALDQSFHFASDITIFNIYVFLLLVLT